MASAKLTRYPGGRDVFGGHGVMWFNYTGPNPYAGSNINGGDEIDCVGVANQTGLRSIDTVIGCVSILGTRFIIGQPNTIGPTKVWFLKWFVCTTGAEVANGVDLSADTAIIGIIGG